LYGKLKWRWLFNPERASESCRLKARLTVLAQRAKKGRKEPHVIVSHLMEVLMEIFSL